MIADYVATAFMLMRLINVISRLIAKGTRQEPAVVPEWRYQLWGLVAGALFANSIPHFIHGVSGSWFPAPFSSYLGKGVPTAVVNVLWGCINFAVGCDLVTTSQKAHFQKLSRILTGVGFVIVSVFLAVIFSRLHQPPGTL